MKRICLFVMLMCLFALPGMSQERIRYLKETGNYALLYQGKLEEGYTRGYVNAPYFPQEYVDGSVNYEGMEYTGVPMRLDCLTGKIVMRSPNALYHIVLLPEVAPRVAIGEYDLVYFSKEEKAPDATYFVALYESKGWGIYKQHYVSNIGQNMEIGIVRKEFSLKQRVFLKKGNNWSVLKGRDDFIRQFKNCKEELKAYCKQEKLRPNDKQEKDWIKLASYCETLIK